MCRDPNDEQESVSEHFNSQKQLTQSSKAGMSSAKPNNRKKEPGGQEWGTECGEDEIRVVGYSKIMKTLSAVVTWFILR